MTQIGKYRLAAGKFEIRAGGGIPFFSGLGD